MRSTRVKESCETKRAREGEKRRDRGKARCQGRQVGVHQASQSTPSRSPLLDSFCPYNFCYYCEGGTQQQQRLKAILLYLEAFWDSTHSPIYVLYRGEPAPTPSGSLTTTCPHCVSLYTIADPRIT